MTRNVAIPPAVVRNVRNRWSDVGERWCAQVLTEFDELSTRYQAARIRVLPSRFAFVVAAETNKGRAVIRSTPDPAGPTQAAVVRTFAERQIGPRLIDAFTTDLGTWTVACEVNPGTSLADSGAAAGAGAVTDLFRGLVDQPAPTADMARIDEWLRHRLTNSEKVVDFPVGQDAAPEHERREATAILDRLVATGDTGQLCHGDGYPGNVLIGDGGRLFWIDPRGMAGEASYDVAVFALKASRHVVSRAVPMAARIATLAGINVDRAQSWVAVADAARV